MAGLFSAIRVARSCTAPSSPRIVVTTLPGAQLRNNTFVYEAAEIG
jgi:hypothetical protein